MLQLQHRVERKDGGKTIPWTPDKAVVRAPCLPNSYLDREMLAENEILAYTAKAEDAT